MIPISYCWHAFCQSWFLWALHLFLSWPVLQGRLYNEKSTYWQVNLVETDARGLNLHSMHAALYIQFNFYPINEIMITWDHRFVLHDDIQHIIPFFNLFSNSFILHRKNQWEHEDTRVHTMITLASQCSTMGATNFRPATQSKLLSGCEVDITCLLMFWASEHKLIC